MSAALALAAAAGRPYSAMTGELEALADRLCQVTVRIHTRGDRFDGVGAGVLWPHRTARLIVTNAHVVPPRHGDAPYVEDVRGRIAAARVIARDRDRDLALLEVTELGSPWPEPAVIGDSSALRAGQVIVALGHPFGVDGALSVGIVQAAPNGESTWLRAGVRLAPGNSGGPLATVDGAVVGINAMIVRGLGIAVPARAAADFVRRTLSPPNGAVGP